MSALEVRVLGGGTRPAPAAARLAPEVQARLVWVPSLVDIVCEPGFPGFPARHTPASLAAAARAGGFGELLLSPRVDPVVDTPEQVGRHESLVDGVRFLAAAALTMGLAGRELAEAGLLARAGAVALSDGGIVTADTVVLQNAMEYAREFGLPILLRPADPHLDGLGVVHDSSVSARLGLRGNPGATEEIGVARAVALCRASGATVHLTHLGTARGVEAVAAARREGLSITASTPARNLILDETALDDGRYDARLRLHPPLRTGNDRRALVEGVRAGVLFLSADHQARAPEEKDHEFERAVAGSPGLGSAFAAALSALGELDIVVEALALAPRRFLSRKPESWALVDPEAPHVAPVSDALFGVPLRGAVLDLS